MLNFVLSSQKSQLRVWFPSKDYSFMYVTNKINQPLYIEEWVCNYEWAKKKSEWKNYFLWVHTRSPIQIAYVRGGFFRIVCTHSRIHKYQLNFLRNIKAGGFNAIDRKSVCKCVFFIPCFSQPSGCMGGMNECLWQRS